MLAPLLLLVQVANSHQGIRPDDPSSGRALIAAAAADGPGKLELMRRLLRNGADPNVRDDSGASPLDETAWRGSVDQTALLLDAGAKIDGRNARTGATPLNEAAFKGHRRVVELLLTRGADSTIKDNLGFSPVENAVRQHHPEIARALVAREKGRAPLDRLLEEAVRRDQVDTAAMLLDAGASVNAHFASGATALYDAALKGNGAMVSLLVRRGADLNTRETASGTTALYAAASLGREEATAILLLAGADPNLSNNEGISPLRTAQSNQHRSVAEMIRIAGGH